MTLRVSKLLLPLHLLLILFGMSTPAHADRWSMDGPMGLVTIAIGVLVVCGLAVDLLLSFLRPAKAKGRKSSARRPPAPAQGQSISADLQDLDRQLDALLTKRLG